jgi:divalent metal cation (Fe/Co/Zn/Cd) transporter
MPVASDAQDLGEHEVRAARQISTISLVWTLTASTAAIVVGLIANSLALIAFGAIGYVDAVADVALVYHFGRGLKHDELSARYERLAHRIVTVGLFGVGIATIAVSVLRLATGREGDASLAALMLASFSFLALIALARRKRAVAERVQSEALRADSRLSGVGALHAAIAIGGVAATTWLAWHWADAAAAAVVGLAATVLAVVTRNDAVDAQPRATKP